MENSAIRNETNERSKNLGAAVKDIGVAARDMKDALTDANKEAMEAGTGILSETRDFLRQVTPDYVKQSLSVARDSAKKAVGTTETTLRRNVWTAVFGAATVGVVFGAFLFRSRKRA